MSAEAATETDRKPGLDALDRSIVEATQAGLPLVPDPWGEVARQVGTDAESVKARLAAMQANGIVRRIAAVPNHYALGYRANAMTVWDVPDERVEEIGQRVGGLAFVSHAYERPRHPMFPPDGFSSGKQYSEAKAAQIDDEVSRIVEEAHQRVRRILSERRTVLDDLARLLSQKESVQGEELREMLAAAVGKRAAAPDPPSTGMAAAN